MGLIQPLSLPRGRITGPGQRLRFPRRDAYVYDAIVKSGVRPEDVTLGVDFADPQCWNGNSQTILDRSLSAKHWFWGSAATVGDTEEWTPGGGGRRRYFTAGTNQYFGPASGSNAQFMLDWGLGAATFTLMLLYYTPTLANTASAGIFSANTTGLTSGINVGPFYASGTSGTWYTQNGSGTGVSMVEGPVQTLGWNFWAVSVQHGVALGCFFFRNGVVSVNAAGAPFWTHTPNTPAASSSNTYYIGDAVQAYWAAGSRLAFVGATKTGMTPAQLAKVYSQIKGRMAA